MRVNKDNERKMYVNPINYNPRTRVRLRSSMALQPRLGLLPKRWIRNNIADSTAIVAIGCDLAVVSRANRTSAKQVNGWRRRCHELTIFCFTIALIRFPIPRHGIEEF